jgi:hypothetical protein
MMRDEIEACYAAGWSDGLPVVPPTQQRVDEMLGEREARRDEVLAVLPPGRGTATLEKVAANAVMAGCRPEYFPAVEAALLAVADPVFRLEGIAGNPSPSPMVVVNGPFAGRIGMNGDAGALGAGYRANATIGRALLLCIRNIALARPGLLDQTTIGHPGRYTYCYTESRASPWPPLSVDRGFGPEESTVTVYNADAPFCVCEFGRLTPEGILKTIAYSAAVDGSYNAYFREELWLVIAPEHASVLAGGGLTKADVSSFIYDHARLPAERVRQSGLYGFLETPAWLANAPASELIPILDAPERAVVTVAGGAYGPYTAIILGLGVSVTRKIEEV